jgi:hypothetical protein
MSYKGFCFNVNPSSIKVDYSKNVAVKTSLFATSVGQEVNFEPTKIAGSGKFVGDKAREYANALTRIFQSDGSAYLFVPDGMPIKAYFKNLSISYNSEKNCVSYDFEFVEDYQGKKRKYDFGYTYAKNGENLFDVANRTDVDIQTLFESNDFADLFSLKDGDKVWLQ